jgi:hypothetical protein
MPIYTVQDTKSAGNHAASCACPVCRGLECLQRPRFFAGQLLTEAELNSQQDYILAKNRLHNRYLHGWGVVCGLEVVCNPCDGWVTVKPGYAIDPCGNDIIVCRDQDFDVARRIQECRDLRRPAPCDPLDVTPSADCTDVEQTWCLTIAYNEQEARPATALRRNGTKSCGCCSGNGQPCGCGCHKQAASTSAQTCSGKPPGNGAASGVGLPIGACEPTRIMETYTLDLFEALKEPCAPPNRDIKTMQARWPFLSQKANPVLRALLQHAPDESLLVEALDCIGGLLNYLHERFTPDEMTLLLYILVQCVRGEHAVGIETDVATPINMAAFGTIGAGGSIANLPTGDPEWMRAFCCRLYRAVHDLYDQNPYNVECRFACDPCPTRGIGADGQQEPADSYIRRLRESFCCLLGLLIEYAIDCVCRLLLAPCPPDPKDDRLVLACMTVRNGKILRICNFSCRRYAGSFPALAWWLSLVPILPLIGDMVREFCCHPALPSWIAGAQTNMASLSPTTMRFTTAFKTAAPDLGARVRNMFVAQPAPAGGAGPVERSEVEALRAQVADLQKAVEVLRGHG